MNDPSQEAAQNVELVAVYRLPASLMFKGSCLGSSTPVQIAGLNGEVHLPDFDVGSAPEAYIVPPICNELPPLARRYLLDNRHHTNPLPWGIVRRWNAVTQEIVAAEVSTLLFRFEGVQSEDINYSDYIHGRGHPIGGAVEQLFAQIDAWRERVRLWVRILIDQDVDEDVEASRVSMAGQNLEVLTIDGETVSLPRYANSMRISMLEVEALDEQSWRHVLDLASRGSSPPVEYSLASSARIQLRVHQYRRAVIDAASAVDVTLSDLFHANYTNLPHGLQTTLNQGRETLGWLVDTLTNARGLPPALTGISARLPPDLKSGLVNVRNDVLHRNRTPTYEETARATSLAADLIKLINPLP